MVLDNGWGLDKVVDHKHVHVGMGCTSDAWFPGVPAHTVLEHTLVAENDLVHMQFQRQLELINGVGKLEFLVKQLDVIVFSCVENMPIPDHYEGLPVLDGEGLGLFWHMVL
jgi:hypothetical protein